MFASIIVRTKTCSSLTKVQSRACSSSLILRRIRRRASCARIFGSRSPAMIAWSMSRPETPWMSEITLDSFRCASSSSFSVRCFSAVRAWVRCRRYRVQVRSRRMGSGGMKLAGREPRSVIFASHTESSLSVLGRPGSALTCAAW